MKYGFVIDNRKCIGCHACTVACKTENYVPLGVNRTWVRYVEKGVLLRGWRRAWPPARTISDAGVSIINKEDQVERMSSAWVDLQEVGKGQWKMRQISGVEPYDTSDPDTKGVWWSDAGVHQDITFPVHPDPISGMHCWHQMVRVERASADDRYGDIFVDTNLSFAVYQRWKALARPAPGLGGLRRPLWIPRVVRPEETAFFIPTKKG